MLVAYFAPEGAPVSVAALRAHARRRLPEHMVPSAFFAMDRLPQTPNGKLDLAALPDVAITRDQEVEYVEPRGDVEEALASIWRSTLDVERIGAGDNFFALGGHSLLAAQVRSRIRQRLGVELPLDVLFDDQTLGGLARRIEETATGNGEAPPLRQASRGQELPASHAQETMWRAERGDPGSAAHWIDVSIRITGPLDAAAIVSGVHRVVERNEVLRTTFRPSEAPDAMLSQVILESYVPEVPITDGVPDPDATPDAREWRDLGTRPPFRADVTRVADDHHVLRLRVHRILADGYSMRLLLGVLGGLIASSLGFDDFPVLESRLQYADYAVWERSWLTGAALTSRVDHFRRQFATADLPPALPTDHPRTGRPDRLGCQFAFEFPPTVAAGGAGAGRARAGVAVLGAARGVRDGGGHLRRPALGGHRGTADQTHGSGDTADDRAVHEHRPAAHRPRRRGRPARARPGGQDDGARCAFEPGRTVAPRARSAERTARTGCARHRRVGVPDGRRRCRGSSPPVGCPYPASRPNGSWHAAR